MADNRKAVASYLQEHQGSYIRAIVTAMRDSGQMSWNTAYKTITRMAEEGTVTITNGRRDTSYDGGVIAPNRPRNKPVKVVWLTAGDDGSKPLQQEEDRRHPAN